MGPGGEEPSRLSVGHDRGAIVALLAMLSNGRARWADGILHAVFNQASFARQIPDRLARRHS